LGRGGRLRRILRHQAVEPARRLDRGQVLGWIRTRRAAKPTGGTEMKRCRGTWGLAVILTLSLAPSGAAQPADDLRELGRDIEALKAGQAAIHKELGEIKALLRAPRAAQAAPQRRPQTAPPIEPSDVQLSVEGSPYRGDKGAKVTVVEFTDYQCPFCSRHFRQTWPQLEQEYVKTGKVKLVLRDLPLDFHPQAFKAAEATHCAAEQGKYWEMHDRLFADQRALGRKDLSAHAQALGLDTVAFDACVDSGKAAGRIRKDMADSEMAGARGTPIFYIGLTDPQSSSIKAVAVIRGARPYAVFKEAIDTLLTYPK
jgi:protein-disulfide isomerase